MSTLYFTDDYWYRPTAITWCSTYLSRCVSDGFYLLASVIYDLCWSRTLGRVNEPWIHFVGRTVGSSFRCFPSVFTSLFFCNKVRLSHKADVQINYLQKSKNRRKTRCLMEKWKPAHIGCELQEECTCLALIKTLVSQRTVMLDCIQTQIGYSVVYILHKQCRETHMIKCDLCVRNTSCWVLMPTLSK
jgi:hypothetical protein